MIDWLIASGCFMIAPDGRQINLDFCGTQPAISPALYLPQPSRQNTPILPNPSGETKSLLLTKEKYEKLLLENSRRDNPMTIGYHDNPLTLGDFNRILGFPGIRVATFGDIEQWRWKDGDKRIEGFFSKGKLKEMRATGFN